jgi:hypothetical protein
MSLNTIPFTKEIILKIVKDVSGKMIHIKKEVMEKYDIKFSNKNMSEILGKIMERSAADIFSEWLGHEVKFAKLDKEPDLYFTELKYPMEIKVTSTTNTWTGGEFSKRPFDYFLISWDPEDYSKYFVCLTHLEKENWQSNISKNFYGPSLKIKTLHDKEDKIIFLGRIVKTDRGAYKIQRESINQQTFPREKS